MSEIQELLTEWRERGKSAAGNVVFASELEALDCLREFDNGESFIPEPFSGEWAGESLPELFGSWKQVPDPETLDLLENEYVAAYLSELKVRARAIVGTLVTDYATVWACLDCLAYEANYEDHPREAEFIDFANRNRGVTGGDVSLGLMRQEHAEDCNALAVGTDCECERITFSMSACDICRSPLGGERHAFTVTWEVLTCEN